MARPGKKLFNGSMPKGTAMRTPERIRMKASILTPKEPRINKAKRGLVNFQSLNNFNGSICNASPIIST